MMKRKYVIITFLTLVFIMTSATSVVARDAIARRPPVPPILVSAKTVNVQQSEKTTITSTAYTAPTKAVVAKAVVAKAVVAKTVVAETVVAKTVVAKAVDVQQSEKTTMASTTLVPNLDSITENYNEQAQVTKFVEEIKCRIYISKFFNLLSSILSQ